MKKSQSTLKIKNITFSKQFSKNIDQDTIRYQLKSNKNSNQACLSRSFNKQNSTQKKQEKHITESFNIKTIHPSKSCLLLLHQKTLNQVLNRYQSQAQMNHLNNAKPYFFKRKSSHQELLNSKESDHQNLVANRLASQLSGRRYSKKKTQKPLEPAMIQKKKLIINTNDKIFSMKLSNYFQFLKQTAKFHGIQVNFSDYEKFPVVAVGGGNNSQLVKQILKKRWWLKIKDKKNSQAFDINQINLIWTQLKVKEYFVQKNTEQKIMHNHFEFNGQLGNKKQLFMNMKNFYESQNKNPFSHLPLTFHLKNTLDQDFQQFKLQFEIENQNHPKKSQLWIVKPGQNSNRGQGITIHSELESIKKLIDEQNSGKKENLRNSGTFIVQKYIQKPFLYQKRKFDIRCYYLLVSLNNCIKAYWYKQGYIRTSCFQFDCNSQNKENIFVHLTNDAVQKNHQNYGKFQDGNKIDFNKFKKYLEAKYPSQKYDFETQIWDSLKNIAIDTIKATYLKLKSTEKPMFQIFGLDFMIDQDFKPWLIEVNTNPCLQTTCLVLQKIIPKMVEDSFQLSIDLIFPPPQTWSNSRKHLVPNPSKSGFEMIFDEEKENKGILGIENP